MLRCTWSFKLSPHLDHFNDWEGGIFVMEFLEVFRRFIWIFFRVETEWGEWLFAFNSASELFDFLPRKPCWYRRSPCESRATARWDSFGGLYREVGWRFKIDGGAEFQSDLINLIRFNRGYKGVTIYIVVLSHDHRSCATCMILSSVANAFVRRFQNIKDSFNTLIKEASLILERLFLAKVYSCDMYHNSIKPEAGIQPYVQYRGTLPSTN